MSKPLNVWILQTGEPLHCDEGTPRPMRAMNLANTLVANGHNVTLFSSAFNHTEKTHRTRQYKEIDINDNLQLRLIPSPGYVKHQGLARLYDHAIMAKNLAKLLDKITDLPDVAFVGYPPIEVAYVMTKWLKARSVPHLLDVKDQWPHIFVDSMPKPLRPIARVAFAPYFYLGKETMKNADGLTSMADGFLNWAVAFAGRSPKPFDKVVPLTTPKQLCSAQQTEKAKEFWSKRGVDLNTTKVVFSGTFSSAFDMKPVLEAARYFNEKAESGGPECQFIMCGDGPLMERWKNMFAGLDNVHFSGWVDKVKLEVVVENALAVLAPFFSTPNFIDNISNKIVDGLAFNKAILSPLKGAVEKMLKDEQVGLFYDDKHENLVYCIERLLNEKGLLEHIETRSKNLYEEKYEFNQVYQGLVAHLTELATKG